jgi:hypothetical protein
MCSSIDDYKIIIVSSGVFKINIPDRFNANIEKPYLKNWPGWNYFKNTLVER